MLAPKLLRNALGRMLERGRSRPKTGKLRRPLSSVAWWRSRQRGRCRTDRLA